MPNGIIYKVTHKESGESYIGATTKTMETRKADHVQKANKNAAGCFQEAIATQGPEAFTWTQIDTANTVNELAQKEKDYIFHYNSKENGYNSSVGGEFKKKVFQYDLETLRLVADYNSLEEASKSVQAHKNSIAKACSGENRTCRGYYWSYSHPIPIIMKDQRRKTVIQMDLHGQVIAKHNSVAEASRSTGVSKTCIARCCRGERDKSSSYMWKYN